LQNVIKLIATTALIAVSAAVRARAFDHVFATGAASALNRLDPGYPQASRPFGIRPARIGHHRRMTLTTQGITSHPVPGIADDQAGLFTRQQAIDHGFTSNQVAYRIRKGLWVPVAGDALAPAGLPVGATRSCWAAWLTWPDSVVIGPVALAAQLPAAPLPVINEITCAVPSRRRRRRGIRPRQLVLTSDEARQVGGGRLQQVVWAAVDTLAYLDKAHADSLFAWLITRNRITPNQFANVVAARANHRGVVTLREYHEWIALGVASALEFKAVRVLQAAGIEGFELNVTIRIGRNWINVDVLFRSEKVVVEADGRAFHSAEDAFNTDRERSNALEAAGYRVIRVTWKMLTENPDRFVAQLRATLRQGQ